MKRVGVLVSGRGSNLGALLDDAAQADAPYAVGVVISNRPGAPALERARRAAIPAVVVERAAFGSRREQQLHMVQVLHEHAVDLVVTAGFDQILVPAFIDAFPARILNVHPSLLPAFAGTLHAQEEALAYGVKVSGCTVHIVTSARSTAARSCCRPRSRSTRTTRRRRSPRASWSRSIASCPAPSACWHRGAYGSKGAALLHKWPTVVPFYVMLIRLRRGRP